MLNIVLFGPPGAGKGTQSEKLIQKYGLTHISTGDLFRYNIKNETPLGKEAKSYIDEGKLVPDQVTIGMLEAELLNHKEAKGVIFDGFPRTVAQAEALDELLEKLGTSITKMVALEVGEKELVARLLDRGKTSGRSDDQNVDLIKGRVKEYNEKTLPVANFYKEQGKYKAVEGVGSIDEIFERITKAIDA